MKAKELPSALLDVGKSTAEKLKARGLQASDLLDTAKSKLSGTLADVQSHASDVITQAKNTFDNATLTLKDSANIDELKSNFKYRSGADYEAKLTPDVMKIYNMLLSFPQRVYKDTYKVDGNLKVVVRD